MSSPIKRVLKVFAWLAGILVVIFGFLWGYVQLRWDAADSRPVTELEAPSDSASIARGELIFTYQSHCWTCHQAHYSAEYTTSSGGMLFDLTEIGPGFGKWYSRNLTPDMETGLGGWTDGEIVRALREGLRNDGTPLFPVMPIDWYHGMADDDALAVVAYLRTLPPVKNQVPERQPSFAAKALFTFGVMKPKAAVTKPIVAPPRGVTAEYGKYLSNNLADCADCHTPRDLQDGHFFFDQMFAGSSFPFGGGDEGPILVHASNISPDVETGIGSWSEEDFLNALTTGMRPDSTVLSPVMPYGLYKFWDQDDLRAVYAYLKSIPPVSRTTPAVGFEPRLTDARGVERGGMIFHARCRACHGDEGRGALPTNVHLADVLPSLNDADLTEFIQNGELNLGMPAFGKTLTDSDLTDLIAYLRTIEAPGQEAEDPESN